MSGSFFFAVAALILVLLFLPILLETSVYYDMNARKLTFAVYAYRIFPLVGGYIATYSGGIAAHLSKKKAVLLPYRNVNEERKRFSVLRCFCLRRFSVTTETGADYLLSALALQRSVCLALRFKTGERAAIDERIWLEDGDVLRVSAQGVLSFNLFVLLRYVLKKYKEKSKSLCRKRKKKSES